MIFKPGIFFLTFLLINSFCILQVLSVDSDPYRHREILDSKGNYLLEWEPDFTEKRVTFNVTVRTRGWVGFGLTRKGRMAGADIVMGGVTSDGRAYFSDRHGIGHQLPVRDDSQDWSLHQAWENSTHTFLSFSRLFDTCDEHDMIIDDNLVAPIWAYGETDRLEYHQQNRGSSNAYLLDPVLTPREIVANRLSRDVVDHDKVKIWQIDGEQVIPPKDTTYMCSVHKAPGGRKKHIIGYNQILPTELDRRHVHHYLVHRCHVPPGEDAAKIFEPVLGLREECYILGQPIAKIPTNLCQEVIHVWAVGQNPNFYPDHVGVPMSENPNEYYMLQMHFDNPDLIRGIRVSYSMEVFYTERLREHDGGALFFGELNPASPTVMVPPNSENHLIYGHCGSGCTQKMLPPEGVKVFAAYLHTHLAGRGETLNLIRNNRELRPIIQDDNYNFNYQQIRTLREERLMLPGDQLINRCVYENLDRNGNVTVGGFSTRNEMCSGAIYYYNKIEVSMCRSVQRSRAYRDFLQIYNTTWSNEAIEMVVTSPEENAGLLVSEVGNYRIDWTPHNRNLIQYFHRYLPQISVCFTAAETIALPTSTNRNRNISPNRNNNRLIGGQSSSSSRRWSTNNPNPNLRRQNLNQNRQSHNLVPNVSSNRGRYDRIRTFNDDDGEILYPGSEFVSVYRSDVIHYVPPNVCPSRRDKERRTDRN